MLNVGGVFKDGGGNIMKLYVKFERDFDVLVSILMGFLCGWMLSYFFPPARFIRQVIGFFI